MAFGKYTLEEVKQKQALKLTKVKEKTQKATKVGKAPKKRTKAPKQKTQAQLKKELDTVFSLYIRKVHPAVCYTCGKTGIPLQNGHFISRGYLATRFHENNCRPQCIGCNIFGNGKPLDFEERLKKELGDEYVENMKASRHQVLKLDRQWYLEKISYYKSLL